MASRQLLDISSKYLRVAGVAGDNVQCYCPFHKGGREASPSFYFYVGPPRGKKLPGMSFCHTCDKGWSLRTLLLELRVRPEIVDALLRDIPAAERRDFREDLDFSNPTLPEALLGVFDWCPRELLNKGFGKSLLRSFEIGYDKGLRRITFPLRDHLGALVGISGRATMGADTRYLIYGRKELGEMVPGYEAVSKGRVLWGLHRFYATAMQRRIPYVVVVEGFKAAMWVAQAGFEYVVALMGSRATDEQAALLLRLGAPVLLFLDNDEPGKQATPKANKTLRRQSPEIYPVRYEADMKGMSPDDLTGQQVRSLLEGTYGFTV